MRVGKFVQGYALLRRAGLLSREARSKPTILRIAVSASIILLLLHRLMSSGVEKTRSRIQYERWVIQEQIVIIMVLLLVLVISLLGN